MFRSRTVLLLSVSLLLILGMLWGQGVFSPRGSATAASASNVSCTGPLTGTFNNVVVPKSAPCTLSNVMVQGSVQVQQNASLVVGGASTILGNVAANGCLSVMLSGTVVVGGDVSLANCTMRSGYTGPGIQISGSVACSGNTGPCVVESGTVGKNVSIQNNTSAAATDISLNRIGGNLSCQRNTPPPTHLLGPNVVAGTAEGQCSASLGFVSTNPAPVANAGPDQTVAVGTTVHLDGSRSYDIGGAALSFHWAFTSPPAGSLATLSDLTAVQPTFGVDKAGTYTVQLVVNDGTQDSAPATVRISTTNSPPVAKAGPNQTVAVGTTVHLDGSQSSDVDGDPLTFHWAITTAPAGSLATLSDSTAVQPTFVVDLPGTYTVQLIVNDGTVNSDAATVVISTKNSRPVANAGPDQTVFVGTTVALDGSQSSDVDHDPLHYHWAITVLPAGSLATLSDPTASQPTVVVDRAGTYVVQLIVNDGTVDSASATSTITAVADTQPPQLSLDPPDGAVRNTATLLLTMTYQDAESGVDLTSVRMVLDGVDVTSRLTVTATQATYQTTLPDGPHRLEASVRDRAGNAAQGTVQFSIDTVPPAPIDPAIVTVGPVSNGQVTVQGAAGSVEPNARVTVTNTRTGQRVTVTATAGGSFMATLLAQSGDRLALTSTDAAGNTSTPITVTVGSALPPDPATVAPPLDRSVATDLATATAFLYSGPTPIQTGVAPGTIVPRRAAVLRGAVLDRSGAPLPGVTIAILNHPEFGQTLSRADGQFDLAVNGGGPLTVRYEKAGLLAAQRQVNVPWQDYAWMPDVVLIALDAQVTAINLSASAPMQVARSSVSADADGQRQSTLLFPQGVTATAMLPGGMSQPLASLHVRSTEYTVGSSGPAAMPAVLPPASAYTYAVELTADEADALGAQDITFSQPVIHYVENFLRLPVGAGVPVGFYDRRQGVWIPSDNGRIIQIVSITNGLANVDIDGSGQAASSTALAALGSRMPSASNS